jgi:hypothetical protein
MQGLVYDFVAIVNILMEFIPKNATKVPGGAFHSENVTSGDSTARIIE